MPKHLIRLVAVAVIFMATIAAESRGTGVGCDDWCVRSECVVGFPDDICEGDCVPYATLCPDEDVCMEEYGSDYKLAVFCTAS